MGFELVTIKEHINNQNVLNPYCVSNTLPGTLRVLTHSAFQQPNVAGIIIPILQMGELRPTEVI